MKNYKVTIQKLYDTEFEIEAENEEEASRIANEMFDELEIQGTEMYNSNEEIEELEK